MGSLISAIRTIEREYPDMRVLWGYENSQYYYFPMERRSWDGYGGPEYMCQGISYGINKKSGKCELIDFYELEGNDDFMRIDDESVLSCLTEEDAEFARGIVKYLRTYPCKRENQLTVNEAIDIIKPIIMNAVILEIAENEKEYVFVSTKDVESHRTINKAYDIIGKMWSDDYDYFIKSEKLNLIQGLMDIKCENT